MTTKKTQKWDAFVSYASEDGKAVALPLAELLTDLGLRVWMDQTELTVGDPIRRKIDEGLAKCRYGIVILSPNFFAKEYPQRELDGLASREHDGRKVILPVWYGVDVDDIRRVSPMLADRFAVRWDEGIDTVATELLRVIDPDRLTRILAEQAEGAKKAAEAEVRRVTSAAELTRMFDQVYGFEFHNDELHRDDVELVAGFQKELFDWSDIWRDMDPLDHAHAEVHLGDGLTALHEAGWSMFARIEQRRIDMNDSREWPIAVVIIVRGEPTSAFSIDGLIGVVRKDEEN